MADCPHCKKEGTLLFRVGDLNRGISRESFPYYSCADCRLIFLSPVPGNLGDYYPQDYYPLPATLEKLAAVAEGERYKLDIVRQFAQGGRLLEIGPAHGCFAYLAKEAGFAVEVIEMDEKCCRFLQDVVGVKVVQDDDPVAPLKNMGNFDVIVLWHVIEHLADPWPALDLLAAKLAPRGVMIIAAPNPDALQFRILGRFWAHVDAPRHLSLIPAALLQCHLERDGLKSVLATTNDPGGLGWNLFGWRESLMNLSQSALGKRLLGFAGRIIARVLRPIERGDARGSAYTIVFRKEPY